MIKCKGNCDCWVEKRPHRLPFLTHSRCRICDRWIKNKDVINKIRCPCCNGRDANRPRLNTNKRKYIALRLAK